MTLRQIALSAALAAAFAASVYFFWMPVFEMLWWFSPLRCPQ
jgi:hypothetical protein